MRRLALADVPRQSEDAAAAWIRGRFQDKEKRLQHFYDTGAFPGNPKQTATRLPFALAWFVLLFFPGLFLVLLWLLATHTLATLAYLVAYAGFFTFMKSAHGGLDKFVLHKCM